MQRLAPRHRATLALVGGWLLFFATQLLDTTGVPYERDLTQLYIPLRTFMHAQLKAGQLPQWFPYELIGVPLLGQIVPAFFHPQTLLFLPFTPVIAVKLNVLLAYLLGAAGAYRFARASGATRTPSVLAAFAFAFTGYGLSLHNNLPYLMGMMTLPWVGWRAIRLAERERLRDAAALAIAWALVFLAGDMQGTGFATVLVIATLIGAARSARAVWLSLGALGLTGLLISIELLPALAVFGNTFRLTTDAGDAPARVWALHPWRLLEMFVPGFLPAGRELEVAGHLFGTSGSGLWAISVFTGALAPAFFLLGLAPKRRSLAFAGLVFIALWMALGNHGGLMPVVFKLIPALSHFAYPEKYLALVSAAAIPLVALGARRAEELPQRAALVLGAVAVGAFAAALALRPAGEDPWAVVTRAAWQSGGLITLAVAGATAGALLLSRRSPALLSVPVAMCFLELWRAGSGIITLADRRIFETTTPIIERVQQSAAPGTPIPRVAAVPAAGLNASMHDEPDRWALSTVRALKPDAAAIWGVGTIGMALLPALPSRMLPIATEQPSPWSRWLRACWRTEPLNAQLPPEVKPVLQDTDANIALVSQPCFPFAFAGGALRVSDQAQATTRMKERLPANMILWEGGPEFPRAHTRVNVDSYAPGQIALTADAEGTAAVVITEGFSPGWAATVDGQPTPIWPTNLVAMGIEVPAGHHELRFEYRTPRLKLGAALTLLGLLLAGLLFVASTLQGRRSQTV